LKILFLYLINVVAISLPLAVLEIYLEKFKSGPWGDTEFTHGFWGRRIRGEIVLFFGKDFVTMYQIVVFGTIIVGLTALCYATFADGLFVIVIGDTSVVMPAFVAAIVSGIMVTEDLLWFAIQTWTGWREPEALDRLFRGDYKWHGATPDKWLHFMPGVMIPRCYVTYATVSVGLLFGQDLLVSCAKA